MKRLKDENIKRKGYDEASAQTKGRKYKVRNVGI